MEKGSFRPRFLSYLTRFSQFVASIFKHFAVADEVFVCPFTESENLIPNENLDEMGIF